VGLEDRRLLSGYTLSTLATFPGGVAGEYPGSNVIRDSSGDLFGSAQGGASGDGIVYKVARGSGTIATIASFDGNNGIGPNGLAIDLNGNLFGTTSQGGQYNLGTVFEIPSGSNTIQTLFNFTEESPGFGPHTSAVLDGEGNFYFASYQGVYKVAIATDTVTQLAGFDQTSGFNPIDSLALDEQGNLYGVTYSGGASGDGTVWELASGTSTITLLASFGGPSTGTGVGNGIVLNPNGDIFWTNEGTVCELPRGSDTIIRLAVSLSEIHGGVLPDSQGNLFGTTWNGGAFGEGSALEIPEGSSALVTLVSFDGTDGAEPFGNLTIDSQGNLYGTTTAGGTDNATSYGTVFEVSPNRNTSSVSVTASSATSTYHGRVHRPIERLRAQHRHARREMPRVHLLVAVGEH
jgi:uncharacterized repeat protein (TIGR03803 family)